jgi:hypothetical protein
MLKDFADVAGMDRVDCCAERPASKEGQAELSAVSYGSLWTAEEGSWVEIKGVWVNKREAQYDYNDVYRTRLHEGSTVHQHHQLRKRIREITKLDWGELSIALPKQVKIEPQVFLFMENGQADGVGIHWDSHSTCSCYFVYGCNTCFCVS